MKAILYLSFDDVKGINCEHCMLSSVLSGYRNKCMALGNRPLCPEEGCRRDCPLIAIDDSDKPLLARRKYTIEQD